AVNWTLYRPGDSGCTTVADTGEAPRATAGAYEGNAVWLTATPSGRCSRVRTGSRSSIGCSPRLGAPRRAAVDGILLSGSLRTTTGTSGRGATSAMSSAI